MVEATGRGCPGDTSVHSTEAPTEAAAENGCPGDTSVHSTEAPTEVAAENGCPVDTSVQSTEAPTEATAETLLLPRYKPTVCDIYFVCDIPAARYVAFGNANLVGRDVLDAPLRYCKFDIYPSTAKAVPLPLGKGGSRQPQYLSINWHSIDL